MFRGISLALVIRMYAMVVRVCRQGSDFLLVALYLPLHGFSDPAILDNGLHDVVGEKYVRKLQHIGCHLLMRKETFILE